MELVRRCRDFFGGDCRGLLTSRDSSLTLLLLLLLPLLSLLLLLVLDEGENIKPSNPCPVDRVQQIASLEGWNGGDTAWLELIYKRSKQKREVDLQEQTLISLFVVLKKQEKSSKKRRSTISLSHSNRDKRRECIWLLELRDFSLHEVHGPERRERVTACLSADGPVYTSCA